MLPAEYYSFQVLHVLKECDMSTGLDIMVSGLDCSETVNSEEMKKDVLALEKTLLDQLTQTPDQEHL